MYVCDAKIFILFVDSYIILQNGGVQYLNWLVHNFAYCVFALPN